MSIFCDINMMVACWGEMRPQKVVGFQTLPQTWSPECGIFLIKKVSTFLDINMKVANWGEMHPQKGVGFQPLPHTWSPEYDIFFLYKKLQK